MTAVMSPGLLLLSLLSGCGVQSPVTPAQPERAMQTPTSDERVPNPAPGAQPLPAATAARLRAAAGEGGIPRTRHLAPDGSPLFTNRLALEASPYLRQHAHNPVDWYPWGDEAFEAARRLGRPVLLSVGYATCHWCHVMEEESFEDLEIARFINENYIAIKVDREERPDVDAVYMAAVYAITGRGGWPMTVWLSPDRRPFYGGTYFPARDGDRGGRPGFLTLLQRMAAVYRSQPERIAEAAAELAGRLEADLSPALRSAPVGAEQLRELARRYKDRYDPVNGGLSGAPKFPSSLPIRFLLRASRRSGDGELLEMATHTLRRMAAGGIYDQVGGGFHRYATDARWLVPHFEKMLYDNALLAVAYTEAWQLTGDGDFQRVAREILRYAERDMRSPEGGFYSATDADSPVPGTGEREEGYFFTWTPEELRAALPPGWAEAVIAWYAVRPGGNFEGRSILNTPRPLGEVARELGRPEGELEGLLAEARERLYAARSERPPPLRDDKVITAWNGLMISAYARASLAFGDASYAAVAARAADFVLSALRTGGRLHRAWRGGAVRGAAVIEDYAFLIAGLIDLFEATGERRWLEEAIALDEVVQRYYEDAAGGWFRTASDGEALLAREKPDRDGAEPSGASVQVLSLYRLAELTGREAYRERADRALSTYGERAAQGAMSELLLAADWSLDTPREIVLITPSSRAEAEPFLRVLREVNPRSRVLVVSPEPEVAALARTVPLVEDKVARGGLATAYVCERGRCELPTTDPERFRVQLAGD